MNDVIPQVRLPDELRAPVAADELRVWDRGAELIRRGKTWPVPFLRPWLRRRGRALQLRVGWWTSGPFVTLTDWQHAPLYSSVEIPGLAPDEGDGDEKPPSIWARMRWKLQDWRWSIANRLGLDHWSDWRWALRTRAERWGIW